MLNVSLINGYISGVDLMIPNRFRCTDKMPWAPRGWRGRGGAWRRARWAACRAACRAARRAACAGSARWSGAATGTAAATTTGPPSRRRWRTASSPRCSLKPRNSSMVSFVVYKSPRTSIFKKSLNWRMPSKAWWWRSSLAKKPQWQTEWPWKTLLSSRYLLCKVYFVQYAAAFLRFLTCLYPILC